MVRVAGLTEFGLQMVIQIPAFAGMTRGEVGINER